MADETVILSKPAASEVQPGWNDLKLRVAQLEAERAAHEGENKALRFLLERVIDHRQKSHSELVNLLAGLVSKLPMNDIGSVISRLVEHNKNVNQYLTALLKGAPDAELMQSSVLKTLEQTKQDLANALKPLVEELTKLEVPIEPAMLQSFIAKADNFFLPPTILANRCFLKGNIPRERIIREFGEEALPFFNDLTTDPKLNPRPKQEEIVMAFKSDFETLLSGAKLSAEKTKALQQLHQKVQRSKGEQARAQKNAFLKLSFILSLLYYYEHQNTEAPDVVFAQRLPAVIEQLVVTGPQDALDEKLIAQAEALLALVINPDHRAATINNIGKAGGAARTLKYILKLRVEKIADYAEVLNEFVRHLIPMPPEKPPSAQVLAAPLRFVSPEIQKRIAQLLLNLDRLSKGDGVVLAKALADELKLTGFDVKGAMAVSPERESELAWDKIKQLIAGRAEPTAVAAAIRERLHAKYESDEVKKSWVVLTETDPMSFIRIFGQMPYTADGKTDPIAQAIMETYVTRLIHEKYAATYQKVLNSLKNIFKTKPDSPALVNFISLTRWVSPEAADKISADVGMPVHS